MHKTASSCALSAQLVFTLLAIAKSATAAEYSGRVIDSLTHQPIANAIVTLGDRVVRTDTNGVFHIQGSQHYVGVRAYGYLRKEVPAALLDTARITDIQLTWFRPKAVYLSFFGIGHKGLREAALKLIEDTELNSVVIDVKGDRAYCRGCRG